MCITDPYRIYYEEDNVNNSIDEIILRDNVDAYLETRELTFLEKIYNFAAEKLGYDKDYEN